MALIEANWNPTRRELRIFGLGSVVIATLLAAWLHLGKNLPLPWALAIIGAGLLLFLSALLLPGVCRLAYLALTAVALPIGMVVGLLLMGILYFLIITPLAMAFRLAGRDHLGLAFMRDADSYWVRRRNATSVKRYFDQF